MHNLRCFFDIQIEDFDRIVQILTSKKQGMSVARACRLSLLPVFEGRSAIKLENIIVVTFEVRSSKAGQRFQALEVLLKEIFTACNAMHLLCVLIGQEHKDLSVEL